MKTNLFSNYSGVLFVAGVLTSALTARIPAATIIHAQAEAEAAPHDNATAKEVAWLGLGTEEASDALTSQLGLQPGEGLLVTFVAPDSPAAKAGLQKNDLLVEMDGQKLLLPMQLRKLVQMRKPGDKVAIAYYRGGKKQESSATISEVKADLWGLKDDGGKEAQRQFQFYLKDMSSAGSLSNSMKGLRESLAHVGVDRENMQIQLKRAEEQAQQARKAVADAMAKVRDSASGARAKALEQLAQGGITMDRNATVTIRSHNDSARSIVKTDETGTYVIVANPKKRLTAHDKDGHLTFEGEIETPDQQEKVPEGVWKHVQPLLEQLH
jgi:membrane-associated protease RseP (regulator of RpoE activity)